MVLINDTNTYIKNFFKNSAKLKIEADRLNGYINNLIDELEKLIEQISKDNFWEYLPKIIGIDAKLCLVNELIELDDFSDEEIIRLIENDYKTYFKELSGHTLTEETKPSLFFNVL